MANGMESDLKGLEYLLAGLLVAEYNEIKSPQFKGVATTAKVPNMRSIVLSPGPSIDSIDMNVSENWT